jgi:hypothetical protein
LNDIYKLAKQMENSRIMIERHYLKLIEALAVGSEVGCRAHQHDENKQNSSVFKRKYFLRLKLLAQ